MGVYGVYLYLAKEVVDTVKRHLGLDDHRNMIEGHPYLVSQHIENWRNKSFEWSEFESDQGVPDIAEKTLAAVISSFMITVCTSKGQNATP